MVARRLQHAALQTIQRRLAGYRRTILTPSLQFAGKNPHHRIVAQIVVVDQILVAKRDAEHTLSHQRRNLMLDQLLTPCVIEASRKPRHQSDRSIGLSQQQRSSIRGDRPAVERRYYFASFNSCESKQIRATLCRHRGALRVGINRCCTTIFSDSQPRRTTPCEISGLAESLTNHRRGPLRRVPRRLTETPAKVGSALSRFRARDQLS